MSDGLQNLLTALLPGVFYLALFLVVYIETAVIFAFFIPGDTLLFSAGIVVASSTQLNIWLACSLISLAAFLGDQTAFFLGRKYGISYISKRNNENLNRLLLKAQDFYAKHGTATIMLSRFYPWFRTLVPFLAGMGKMSQRNFVIANIASASIWGFGVTGLGYLANSTPWLKDSSRGIALFFIFLTIVITLKNYLRERKNKNATATL
jgi:membrane-associated protein